MEMDMVEQLKHEISFMKTCLHDKEKQLLELLEHEDYKAAHMVDKALTNSDIARYSRQIIMPEVGMRGQRTLKNSSVLIVGAGGLGCPSALYLAGAGIGHIGIVDYDLIELHNLHRQLLHEEGDIGLPKVFSAYMALKNLNGSIRVSPYHTELNNNNTLDLIRDYDVVLDCTDNVVTRYLLSDSCVLGNRPLVSGSALKLEGQLTVYNYKGGPCYRCLYPTPPPPGCVTNCGDGGVLGAVPGVIGTLQALQTIKILLDMEGVLKQKLLLFDGSDCSFRTVRLRNKSQTCESCGDGATIKHLMDYEKFCGSRANDKEQSVRLLTPDQRTDVSDLESIMIKGTPHLLIDVRTPTEFQICSLPRSVNYSMSMLEREAGIEVVKNRVAQELTDGERLQVFVVCRRGNDSQKAAVILQQALEGLDIEIKDIMGGLHEWARVVDPEFPVY